MRGGKPIYKWRSRVGRKLFRGTPSTRYKRSRSTRKDSCFRYAQTRRQSLYPNSQNCSISELLPIIKGRTDTGAIIYSDGFKSYDGLVNYGYKRHYRVKHGENEFALGHNHINGIENFWGLCKVRLAKFRGVHRHTFYLHIKECEFRYNYRNQNLFLTLLKNFRNHPLKLS